MENSDPSQMGSRPSDVEVFPPHSHTDRVSLHSRDSVDYVDAQTEEPRNENDVSLTHNSKSSSPTSEAEYNSCTNSPKQERSGSEDSQGSQAEATTGSISMSANIADKLNRLRVSRESPEEESEHSSENPRWEEVRDLPIQDSDDSLGPSKRPTPKSSLRQVFPYVSCLPFENNMVFCFVLSVWDNIVGPQTVYVWKRKSFPSQKTFEVFDEPVNIEVAEDSMQAGQNILQQEINPESPSLSKSWESQDTEDWGQSRRHSTASSNLGRLSDRGTPPKQVGIHSKPSLSNKSLNKKRKSVSSIESFCEDIGNSILMESLKAVKTDEERHSPKEATQKTSDAGNDAASEMKQRSETAKENEERGWARMVVWEGRLRVGSVAWYVTEHSVGVGQVGPASDKITSVLHVVPHQGIIILAARFTVEEEEGATPYCLSMVVPVEEYGTFMPLTHTVTTWLLTTAATARLLLTKHGLVGGGYIKDKLVELCEVLVALRSASLDQYPLTPAPRPPDDRRFAEVVLTSHLQTLGASVVVADSPNAANKMIMWLAQFSDPSTLHASRLCLSYSQWPFHPGLYIQGIVRGASGEVNLSAHKLLQSPHPITVVDVGRGIVKQTGAPDVHARRSASALSQELLSLWHDLPDVSVPSESLLEPVRGASPLVKKFLHDYDRLSSCDSEVRQGFVTAFLRSLHYTALALITWTRHQWCGERRRSGYGSLRRALCAVFDLDERDLRVILARTELLEPGFYSYVSSMSQ